MESRSQGQEYIHKKIPAILLSRGATKERDYVGLKTSNKKLNQQDRPKRFITLASVLSS